MTFAQVGVTLSNETTTTQLNESEIGSDEIQNPITTATKKPNENKNTTGMSKSTSSPTVASSTTTSQVVTSKFNAVPKASTASSSPKAKEINSPLEEKYKAEELVNEKQEISEKTKPLDQETKKVDLQAQNVVRKKKNRQTRQVEQVIEISTGYGAEIDLDEIIQREQQERDNPELRKKRDFERKQKAEQDLMEKVKRDKEEKEKKRKTQKRTRRNRKT